MNDNNPNITITNDFSNNTNSPDTNFCKEDIQYMKAAVNPGKKSLCTYGSAYWLCHCTS